MQGGDKVRKEMLIDKKREKEGIKTRRVSCVNKKNCENSIIFICNIIRKKKKYVDLDEAAALLAVSNGGRSFL